MRGICRKDSLIGKAGETFAAHEFHYSLMADGGEDFLLSKPGRRELERRNSGVKFMQPILIYIFMPIGNPKRFRGGNGGIQAQAGTDGSAD